MNTAILLPPPHSIGQITKRIIFSEVINQACLKANVINLAIVGNQRDIDIIVNLIKCNIAITPFYCDQIDDGHMSVEILSPEFSHILFVDYKQLSIIIDTEANNGQWTPDKRVMTIEGLFDYYPFEDTLDLLPREEIALDELSTLHALYWVKNAFNLDKLPQACCPNAFVSYYSSILNDNGIDISIHAVETYREDTELLIRISNHYGMHCGDLSIKHKIDYEYSTKSQNLINLGSAHKDIASRANYFKSLSKSNSQKGDFYYFPYVNFLAQKGLGEAEEPGFRTRHSSIGSLAKRSNQDILIIVFGGSSTWSPFCDDNSMFSSQLEQKLNHHKTNSDINYIVINFGMFSYVVINQMIAYLLFAEGLKPDIVISHDGYNDILWGLNSDSELLSRWNITYGSFLEQWASMMNEDSSSTRENETTTERPANISGDILNSYINRKRQFQSIVERSGSQFIWGVQPILASKSQPSAQERLFTSHKTSISHLRRKIELIYAQLIERLDSHPEHNMILFDRIFKHYDEESTLFGDVVHTFSKGDTVIADAYAQMILDWQNKR